MKYSTLTLVLLSLSGAIAQPHQQHKHQHLKLHEKRDVTWTTTWEIVTETLSITTTVWIDGDETSALTTSTTPVAHTTSSTQSPAEFHQSPTKLSTSTTLTSSSSSVAPYIPPTPSTSSLYVPPPPPSSTYVAPVKPTTTPVYVAPTTSKAPAVYIAPEPTTTAPAPASTTPPSSSSGSDGTCSSGSPCTGDITYYQAGLGACGITSDGDKQLVIALPWQLMGSESNGNPYCGKTVTIEKDGTSIIATVVDKCMGCTGKSIDLSNLAFSSLGVAYSVGRTTANWWFND